MKITVRERNNTDLGAMTLFLKKNKKSLKECTLDWIDQEVEAAPFNEYYKNVLYGALLRVALIATHKTGWLGDRDNNQCLILEEDKKHERKKHV